MCWLITCCSRGWTSPDILGLLVVTLLGAAAILGYEPRRVELLLELRLFRSVPFSSAILMALFALCAFGAFLFVTTLYLQDVRGMTALTAGLCLLPVGAGVVVLAPRTGRLVGARGPRPRLVIAGAALAPGRGRVALARTGHPAAGRARDLSAVRHLPGRAGPAGRVVLRCAAGAWCLLNPYAVLRAGASVSPSDDAWDLYDRLTKVYMSPDTEFPAPKGLGFIVRYSIERIGGVGPWVSTSH